MTLTEFLVTYLFSALLFGAYFAWLISDEDQD